MFTRQPPAAQRGSFLGDSLRRGLVFGRDERSSIPAGASYKKGSTQRATIFDSPALPGLGHR